MSPTVIIANHTTASKPRPHILYTVQVNVDGKELIPRGATRSSSRSMAKALNDPYNLPPKRLLATTFIPSAWVDDGLIAERKIGLTEYLFDILSTPKYKDQPLIFEFLSAQTLQRDQKFDLEDALPSTLTRTKALTLASGAADSEISTSAAIISAAYYPDWSAIPPQSIDFSKFDIIFYAFATPSSTSTVNLGSQAILKQLVTSARNSGYGTRIVLSIAIRWLGGCYYFSQACSTAANRTTFANSISTTINSYSLDGVDVDWEYPTILVSLGSSKIISAAVPHTTWLGPDGNPLADVSAFANELTYVNIMNYDVWGASATPGPNAPLGLSETLLSTVLDVKYEIGDLCHTSTQPVASAQGALAQWKAAKFPASQLLLGLPLYGYVSKSSKTVLTGSSVPSENMNILHQAESRAATASVSLSAYWGQQIAFSDIVKAGALVKKSDGTYGQAGGFTMAWDNCSDTPYLYNTAQTTVVTYDDTWSLADKAAFAKTSGMAGCFTWSLDQDDGLTLQNAIRKALGK
ncbi:glycoside hydrolase superfamily [Flammula alnicola]|nr:glycoside hydrolase superfamily [Flammula alnicola]